VIYSHNRKAACNVCENTLVTDTSTALCKQIVFILLDHAVEVRARKIINLPHIPKSPNFTTDYFKLEVCVASTVLLVLLICTYAQRAKLIFLSH